MKRNARKQIGRRTLSLAVTLALFMQVAPFAAITASAEEVISTSSEDAVTQIVETAPETENVEPALEETVLETEQPEQAVPENSVENPAEQAQDEEGVESSENSMLAQNGVENTQEDNQDMVAPAEDTAEEQDTENSNDLLATAVEGNVVVTSANQLLSGVPAGSTYVLANDINMEPGQQIGVVAGVLDGAGYTITINGNALVGQLTGTIQNLMVAGKASLSNGQGSIVCTINGGTLQNCSSTVSIDPGWDSNMGGLAGNVENGKIYNSYFAGSGKDEYGLVANNGIFSAANNENAKSQIKNCYFVEGNGVGGGSGWNRDDTSNGKKTLEQMQTSEFVQLLNASNVGSGYVWAYSEGNLPKLVPGGGELEQSNKTALEAAIKEAQSKNESDYTNESFALMQQALQSAIVVCEKIDAVQAEVDAATKTLQEAIASLKEKERNLAPVEVPQSGVVSISSQADLAKIDGNDPKAFYQLTQDIVVKDNFLSPNLAGVLDGNGHTITICTASPLFNVILETGIVQNLHVKVEGNFTNRMEFAPFAEKLSGGMIVNCISEVTGQHSAGYVHKMENGVLVNCLTMGHNRRGAFVHYQKSTDHQNSNGYKSGKFYNCYWSASNSVENITPAENLVDCAPVGDEQLRSDAFMEQLNAQKGTFGIAWGRDENGYPYFGADKGDHVIDGSQNRYTVQFVWHDNQVANVKNGNLQLSPQMTNANRFAGTFQLQGVPQDSTIIWSCEDRTNQEIMQMNPKGELYVFHDGGGIVRAMEHKADGTQELAAEIRVVSASREIEQLRVLLDGQVIESSTTVQGSAVNTLEVQAKYAGADGFDSIPAYLVELKSEKPELLRTDYNTASFYFKEPGTSKLTITEKTQKKDPASVTVSVTSAYVPVKSVKPAINDTVNIHYRNSMGAGAFISIPQTVFVEPANASYKDDVTVSSSDVSIAVYDGSAYIPYKSGTVTFTATLNDNGKIVKGESKVTFAYKNPLAEVSATKSRITLDQNTKQELPLMFRGQPGNPHTVTEPDLVWSFDKQGIVSIQRPNPLEQVRNTGGPDDGNWVASTKFEVRGLRPGTVVATGTPVDTTGGAKPVKITITVKGDGSTVNTFDIPKFIENGKKTAGDYLTAHNTFTFGEEWSIYALLRAGQTLPQQKLDDYYHDVAATVRSWNANILATEVERTVMALNIMGKDITNVDGVDLVNMICNHPNLTKQGSNALAWALIALDMNNTPIPTSAKWTRERMISELLTYQKQDGGFGLDKTGISSVDVTAMSLQALARYQNQDDVAEAIENGMNYLRNATEKNLNLGNAESIAQVVITLAVLDRDMIAEPGFGDEMENMMSVLAEYMVEGQGFKHSKKGEVDKMATAQAMQALCAYERFLNGESSYWDLQGTGPIEDPAKKVSAMIDALPKEITVADEAKVKAARAAYDALTDTQKKRVANLDKLLQAESMLAEKLAVQRVMDAIDALPQEITLADAHKVKQVRQAYNQLTAEQQMQVSNRDKLEAAENTLRKLVNVSSVTQMIAELPQDITLEDQDAVYAARAAYELLPTEKQAQVANLGKLEMAEKQLELLLSAQQVQQVVDSIHALPEQVTLQDAAAVQAARDAYEQLTESQKAQVYNVDKLLYAEKTIQNLQAAQKVEEAIQALAEPVSIADKQAVQAARAAYDALSAEQKELVHNLDKLLKAEEDLLDLDAAQKVMGMIKNLPVEITAADKQAVMDARNAYQALSEKQQKLVLNLYMLERAEQVLAEKLAVQEVEDAIAALPEVITKEDAEAIKTARAAYNQLEPELRKQVKNLDKLIHAEKMLKAMYKPMKKPGHMQEMDSNVIKGQMQNGMISAKQLAEIRGEDLVLRVKGTMENGESYTLSIYGKDIAAAEDFAASMMRQGIYEEEIHKLSENPEIFRFAQAGAFPAPMMVEMNTTLADGEYLLLRYDPVQQRAVLISRVQAADGKVQFIVEEGGEYFLTKKASKKTIPELDAEMSAVEYNQELPNNTEQAEYTVQDNKADDTQKSFVVWLWVIPLLLIVGGGFIVLKKRKENKGE